MHTRAAPLQLPTEETVSREHVYHLSKVPQEQLTRRTQANWQYKTRRRRAEQINFCQTCVNGLAKQSN